MADRQQRRFFTITPFRQIAAFVETSISYRIALLFGFLVLLLSLFLGTSFITRTRSIMLKELEAKGGAISRYVAYNAWYGVFTGDVRSLDALTDGALEEPDVSYVLVVGSQGSLLCESFRQYGIRQSVLNTLPLRSTIYDIRTSTTIGPDGERYAQIISPILKNKKRSADDESLLWESEGGQSENKNDTADEFYGYVVVGLSHESFHQQLQTVIPQIVIAVLVALLVSIAVALLLVQVTTRPLKRIAQTAQMIAAGDLTQRVAVNSRDEIGTLAVSFNKMVSSLRARDRRLQANQSALEQSNRDLRILDQNKSIFLANMSHELRTPLNAVIGFSEVLRDRCFGDLTEKQDEYVNDIWESGRHLLSLINDILDLSKIEAGMMKIENSIFNPETTIRRSAVMVKEKAGQQNIPIEVEIDNLPDAIEADERKLKQIIYNLLSNAVKFTESGGKIGIQATSDNGKMTITVWDTGIGIPESQLERIFSKFEQIDGSASRKYEGTGLGLSLSRSMVQIMGGRIWAEKRPEGGTRFRFTIPVKIPSVDTSSGRKRGGIQNEMSGVIHLFNDALDHSLIHIVEDDEKTADLIAAYLRSGGYRVETFGSGEQFLQGISESTPDAILLDILLPDIDGWDILTRLKENPETRSIPVVIGSTVSDKNRGFTMGAVDYLVKPFGKDDLLSAFGRVWSEETSPEIVRHVLVIDDDPSVIHLVNGQIAKDDININITGAETGEDGIRKAIDQLPDLILLDFLLPDLSCLSVVQGIRSDPIAKDIPIVLITAKDLSEEERKQLRGEIEFFSSKNDLNRADILAEINGILREQKLGENRIWAQSDEKNEYSLLKTTQKT